MVKIWRIGRIISAQQKKDGLSGVIKRDDGKLIDFTKEDLSEKLRGRFTIAQNFVGLAVEFLSDKQGGIENGTIFKRRQDLM